MRRLSLLMCLALVPPAVAADLAKEEAAETEQLCADELPRWKLTADGVPIEQPTEPVLRWTNTLAGRSYGNTYVWLQKGRPVAVGGMFRNFQPWNSFDGELAALAGTKLLVKRYDKVLWQPRDEWQWRPVPGADAPAATAAQRLVQMRALAGELEVQLLDTREVPRGQEQTPRLLPRPLYRYDARQTRTLDGALYTFAVGTDPELMLLLECDTAAAKPEWQFGVGRMNRDTIRLKRKGETVWEGAALREHHPDDVYYYFKLPRQRPMP